VSDSARERLDRLIPRNNKHIPVKCFFIMDPVVNQCNAGFHHERWTLQSGKKFHSVEPA
jgi:hypothetical protein